ncbi:MAG: hypothetical protein N2508_09750 [Anaerolineae bacterium]|nr:hypothetical protein [Anaerolineae bacterium]
MAGTDEQARLVVRINGTGLQVTDEVHYHKLLALQRLAAWRITVDIAHKAGELCAEAFPVGRVGRMLTQHGSIVQKFSPLYILEEQRFAHIGPSFQPRPEPSLRRSLMYEAAMTEEMARETVDLACEMREHLRRYLIEEMSQNEQKDRP